MLKSRYAGLETKHTESREELILNRDHIQDLTKQVTMITFHSTKLFHPLSPPLLLLSPLSPVAGLCRFFTRAGRFLPSSASSLCRPHTFKSFLIGSRHLCFVHWITLPLLIYDLSPSLQFD